MNLIASRGREFTEEFNFKSPQGTSVQVPPGQYVVQLSHGLWDRRYECTNGSNSVTWTVPAQEIDEMPYTTMYYTLFGNDEEIVRGVLKIN